MSETIALALTFAAMLLLVTAAWIGLSLVEAKDGVFVAVIMPIGCAAAFAVSEIVAHYARQGEDRHR